VHPNPDFQQRYAFTVVQLALTERQPDLSADATFLIVDQREDGAVCASLDLDDQLNKLVGSACAITAFHGVRHVPPPSLARA